MENPVTVIFDPFDEPFGPLSPNFQTNIEVDGEYYRSVSHYIYSRLLKNPSARGQLLGSRTTRNLKNLAENLRSEAVKSVTMIALDKAFDAKFKNLEARKALLSTGNAILVYRSKNTFLGIDSNGEGENVVGKKLMALRDIVSVDYYNVMRDEKARQYVAKVYEAFVVDNILREMIMTGNSDLAEFSETTLYNPSELLDQFGRQKSLREGISYEAFMKMYERGQIPPHVLLEAENPGHLAIFNRAMYLERYVKLLKLQEKRFILSTYFDHIIKKKFGTVSEDRVIKELAKLSPEEVKDLEERLSTLYQKALLPIEVMESVKKRYETLPDRNAIITSQDEAEALMKEFNAKQGEKPSSVISAPKAEIEKRRQDMEENGQIPSDAVAIAEYLREKEKNSMDKFEKASATGKRMMITSMKKLRRDLLQAWNERMSSEDRLPYYERAEEKIRQGLSKDEERMISEIQEIVIPVAPVARPVIEFGNTPNRPYEFLAPSFVEPVMLVIDHLPYPSVSHYYLASLMTVLLSYVNGIKSAHSYLMIDPMGSMNNPQNYGQIEYLDDQFDKMVFDDSRDLLIQAAVKGNEAKFADRNLGALLLATGDDTIVYADYNDSILGVGRNDKGENNMGTILMEIRKFYRDAGVEPARVQIMPSPRLVELFKNNIMLQTWFNTRARDIVSSVKAFADYLEKRGETREITAEIVDTIVNKMYANCMSIYDKNALVEKMPKEFVGMIREEFKPYENVTRSAIEIIWRYMSYLLARMTDIIFTKTTPQDVEQAIFDVITSRTTINGIQCKGPFDKRKNCVASSLKNIFAVVEKYLNKRNRGIEIGDSETTLVIAILTPRFDVSTIPVKTSTVESKRMREAIGYKMSEIQGDFFNNYADAILEIKDEQDVGIINSRITFFATTE